MPAKLRKTEGGYECVAAFAGSPFAPPDMYQRFVIRPQIVGDGPRSKGTRMWTVTPDPSGLRPSRTYERLYEVREVLGR